MSHTNHKIDNNPKLLEALSTLLMLPVTLIDEALTQCRAPDGYERYEYPKGDGRVRVILAPQASLKRCQRALLDHIFSQVAVTPFAHGFVPHRSIVTNALIHAPTAHAVLNLDLKDAFPSVSEKRVTEIIKWRVGALLKLNVPYLSSAERLTLCDMIARLCTREQALPQGAPTSGYLLNLACARLDRLVYAAALRSRLPQIKYTRYADDLTLTSSAPIPPEFIAQVKRAVVRSGFIVHPLKVHSYSDSQKAIVICGIRLSNQGLALPKATLKKYRARIHDITQKPAHEVSEEERAQILGVISFLRAIYPAPPKVILKPLNALLEVHSSWLNTPKAKGIKKFAHYTYQGQKQN